MRIIPYRKVSALDVLLKELRTPEARFVVPSRRDREWWKVRAGRFEFGLTLKEEDTLWNWEDVYADLCSFFEIEPLRQIDPPDHRLILSYIVKKHLRAYPDLLKDWPGIARQGFIDLLSDDIRELLNEAVSEEQLEAALENEKTTSKVLPALYRSYTAYLAQNRLMDSAQIPTMAQKLLQKKGLESWLNGKHFVFVGFLSFTHGQLEFIKTLLTQGAEMTILQPATDLSALQDAAKQMENAQLDALDDSSGKLIALCVSDYSLETEALARLLALWHTGESLPEKNDEPFPGFENIAVMIPPKRLNALEASLHRYRIPYTLARGRSLDQTLFGKSLTSLWLAWTQGLETQETALALGQACLAGFAFSIDEAIKSGARGLKGWESYLKSLDEKAVTIRERKNAKRAFKALKTTARFFHTVDKGTTPINLFKALFAFISTPDLWMDALSAITEHAPDLDESLRETAFSIMEVEKKCLALQELQPDLGEASEAILSGKEAFDYLQNWSKDTLIQPSPSIVGAMMVYTAPPPILASYRAWIMTDITQRDWPGIINSSPLLDIHEREAVKACSAYLPSLHDKRLQKEALFRRMLQTGETLTMVYRSATDEEGRPTGTTAFLSSFLSDNPSWRYSEPPAIGMPQLLPQPGGLYFPEIEVIDNSEQEQYRVPVLNDERPGLRLAVSDLYDLLDCPMRYWLRRNARLREREQKIWSDADAGRFTHKLWENIWRRRIETGTPLSLLALEEWQEALRVPEAYSPFASMLKDRRFERHRSYLQFYMERLALLQDQILQRLSETGLKHSKLLLEDELLLEWNTNGVTFSGRCDRIEIFENRCAVIIDYKMGKSHSYEKKLSNLMQRRYLNTSFETFKHGLQLSAYALLYSSVTPEHTVSGVGFLGHRDGNLAGTFSPPYHQCYMPASSKSSSSLSARIDEAQEALRCAADILKNGRYEPCYLSESCSFCDMKGICRKGKIQGEWEDNDEQPDE